MPKNNFRVKVAGNLLPEMQTLTLNTGRRQVTDPYKASTGSITGRNLATLPTVDIGQTVVIEYNENGGTYFPLWTGYVSDFTKSYGFTTSSDQWVLQCEDSLAAAGRASTRAGFSWSAGIDTGTAAAAAGNDASIQVGSFIPSFYRSTVSAQSLPNTNLLEILNKLAVTEQGRIAPGTDGGAGVPGPFVQFFGRDELYNTLDTVFTDNSLAYALTYPVNYNQVEFLSQADSYFDVVIVEPDGLAAQQEGTGTRVLTLSTYDQTTTQADSLAAYLAATLSVKDPTPFSLSVLNDAQSNSRALVLAAVADSSRVQIVLRGVIYSVTVEGGTISADPNQTRCSLYFAPAVVTVPFILDDTVQGVLDQNRLGF